MMDQDHSTAYGTAMSEDLQVRAGTTPDPQPVG